MGGAWSMLPTYYTRTIIVDSTRNVQNPPLNPCLNPNGGNALHQQVLKESNRWLSWAHDCAVGCQQKFKRVEGSHYSCRPWPINSEPTWTVNVLLGSFKRLFCAALEPEAEGQLAEHGGRQAVGSHDSSGSSSTAPTTVQHPRARWIVELHFLNRTWIIG